MKELPARPLQLAMRIYYRPPSIQYTTMLNVERSGASAGVVAQRRFTLALYAFVCLFIFFLGYFTAAFNKLNVERSGASAGVVAQRRFTLALYAFNNKVYYIFLFKQSVHDAANRRCVNIKLRRCIIIGRPFEHKRSLIFCLLLFTHTHPIRFLFFH